MAQLLTSQIGKRLARYRKRNGWSAQRLADNTDGQVSRATIASFESGRRANIHLDQFLALCLALRITPIALLVDLEEPFAPSELRFLGTAPKPLEDQAPNIAIARWIGGANQEGTTPASRRIALTVALSEEYVAARDRLEAEKAVRRLHPGQAGTEQSQLLKALRTAAQRLAEQGIAIPS